jgi:predicted TIM-barrel fold metal-dependent hydrolase
MAATIDAALDIVHRTGTDVDGGGKNAFVLPICMTCLISGGVLDWFPNLTFITHHAGASIPFFEQRIRPHPGDTSHLKKPLLDYYWMFYVDTAIQGSIGGIMAS